MAGNVMKILLKSVVEQLQPPDIEEVKYILKDSFPEGQLAKVQTGKDLATIFGKQNLLQKIRDRKFYKKALGVVERNDLAVKLEKYIARVAKDEDKEICPVKGLIKRGAKLCEFGWVNYAVNDNKIESTIGEILDYKFKQERKIIYTGAGIYEPLEYEAWKQRCQKLLKTSFSRDGAFSGIISFPDKLTAQSKPWNEVINTLKYWIANSNSGNKEDATGLIIRNYDLQKHLQFCGMTDDEINATSMFKSLGKKYKVLKNIERFLVFNPSEKIILIIRMGGSKQHDQLKGEVYHCIDEVTLLSFLLKDELKDSGVIVTGLVVYSGENFHSQTGCIDCDKFIVSSKIFDSGRTFDNFWKSLVSQNIFKMFASKLETREKSNKANLFKAVASKLVGYLAHLQFKISDKPVLPVPEKNAIGNIKQAELLLDKYQMEIAYSDEQRILLIGNYGTGKTVVALKKLELLYESLKEEEVIYYVNFAGKSQLHLEVMEKNKIKEKVKVIRGGTSLSNIVNSKILPDEENNNIRNIHLIVEEYDSQYLSEKESGILYKIFEEEERFKHSTVLIAVQPIEIDRTDYLNVNGKNREYSEAKHMFGKLKKIMKVFKLRNVMRTTVEINNLIELTQNYLNNKTNEYEGELKSYSDKTNKNKHEESLPKLRQESVETSNNTQYKLKPPLEDSSTKPKSSLNVASGFSSASSTNTMPIPSQEIIDYDELYKLASTSSKKDKANLRKVVTKYRYTCNSKIGHGINGPLPRLIKLPKSSDPCEEILLIAFVLLEIIEIKSKNIAIIHFDKDDALWFQLLFKVTKIFSGVVFTNDVGNFLRNTGNVVLVSNYNSVKGLEFSEVLLILEADEYHLKQFIPEAMSRCMNNLAILVRSKPKDNLKSDTVADLLHHWEKSNEKILKTRGSILTLLKIRFCSVHSFIKSKDSIKTHCLKNTSKYTLYKIHKRCQWYRDLSVQIQPSAVRNLHLEARKEPEQAKAILHADYHNKKSKALGVRKRQVVAETIKKSCGMKSSAFGTDRQLVGSFLRAAEEGDVKEVNRFLQDGMPVHVSYGNGWTALHRVSGLNRTDVAKLLLQAGADVNKPTITGDTPLHRAAHWNSTEVARILLVEGADINLKNRRNETPLDCARSDEVKRLLLEIQQTVP